MPSPVSVVQARLGINLPLTNLAYRVIQPQFGFGKIFYPLATVGSYGGQIIAFDESIYEDVVDDRADGADYPEIQEGYAGRPFKLKFKGLMYKIPDKRRNEMANLRINWGRLAVDSLMKRAGLRHNLEAIALATNINNYATTHRITLSLGSQFNEAGVDPDPVIRTACTRIAESVGVMPNAIGLSLYSFNALATKYAQNFTSTNTAPGLRQQLTAETLAGIFGVDRVIVDKTIRKVNGTKQFAMGKDIVIGYVNPKGLNGDALPYRPDSDINMMEPAFGYTYVYDRNPLIYDPGRNEEKGYTYYKMDFDRSVENVGVQEGTNLIESGYLIKNAVA